MKEKRTLVNSESEMEDPNHALRKQAYSNILKILSPKNEIFQIKKILLFFIILLKI